MTPAVAAAPVTKSKADRHWRANIDRRWLCVHRLRLVITPLAIIRRWRAIDCATTENGGSSAECGDCDEGASETSHDTSFQDIVIIISRVPESRFFTIHYSFGQNDRLPK